MGCKAYSLLSLAAIRNGSYQIVLVVEFVCPRLKEKNSPGLPEYVEREVPLPLAHDLPYQLRPVAGGAEGPVFGGYRRFVAARRPV